LMLKGSNCIHRSVSVQTRNNIQLD
jgi:hypothetical protein